MQTLRVPGCQVQHLEIDLRLSNISDLSHLEIPQDKDASCVKLGHTHTHTQSLLW